MDPLQQVKQVYCHFFRILGIFPKNYVANVSADPLVLREARYCNKEKGVYLAAASATEKQSVKEKQQANDVVCEQVSHLPLMKQNDCSNDGQRLSCLSTIGSPTSSVELANK